MTHETYFASHGSPLSRMGLKVGAQAVHNGTRRCTCCNEMRSLAGSKTIAKKWVCRLCVAKSAT